MNDLPKFKVELELDIKQAHILREFVSYGRATLDVKNISYSHDSVTNKTILVLQRAIDNYYKKQKEVTLPTDNSKCDDLTCSCNKGLLKAALFSDTTKTMRSDGNRDDMMFNVEIQLSKLYCPNCSYQMQNRYMRKTDYMVGSRNIPVTCIECGKHLIYDMINAKFLKPGETGI